MREDAKKKINVVNLYEEVVEDAGSVQRLIARAALARETGATGANQESSRSHCIMQFSLKRRDNSNEVRRLPARVMVGLAVRWRNPRWA